MTNLSGANLNNGTAVGPQGEGKESPSTFPKYPAYKDSGVEWLGEVPNHWESRRLKFLFSLQKRPVSDSDGIVTCFRDGAVTLRSNRRTDGFTNAEKEIGYQGIRKGDLVIHAMDAFAGAIGVSDSDGKSSPVYSACIPNEGVSAYYYARLLRHMALAGFISSLAKGIRERSTDFRWSDASEIYLPFPSISEQTQITRFLDHETARIDALIEEQKRLIELLKEKRQVVISNAVTKGLDPTVPMKDSGVEWLGAVPASWKVSGIKVFADLITGITPPSEDLDNYAEEGWPWVRPEDLNDSGRPVLASKFLTDQGWRFCRKVKGGSTLICCIGTIGKLGFVDSDVCTNQQITAVVPRGNGRFFFYAMQALKPAFDVSATGNVLRILNSERLGNVTMAVPDYSEAESIACFLDHETARIDALIEEAMGGVVLLQERCSALISAAVTGKIDVRGWQPPASTQAPEPAVAEAN